MENPIIDIQLVKGRRGRPKKEEAEVPKLWEDKEHVAKYNKLYYSKRRQTEVMVECPDCFKCVKESYFEEHKNSKFHTKFVENMKRISQAKN